MIATIAIIVAVAGGFMWGKDRGLRAGNALSARQNEALNGLARRFGALRNAAYLTDEKGHRVRYWNASLAVRERAENN